jgi:hypothetical protein
MTAVMMQVRRDRVLVVHLSSSLQEHQKSTAFPALASGFIKTDSSTKQAAVYNDVAKKLMVR